jgi:hypothetical protein
MIYRDSEGFHFLAFAGVRSVIHCRDGWLGAYD